MNTRPLNPEVTMPRWNKPIHILGACLSLLIFSADASAQGDTSLEAFEAPSLADQLALDVTPIPAGMGALLVPTLTDRSLEPIVLVYAGDQRVARGTTGQRIPLPPGQYRVEIAAGPDNRRASAMVQITEAQTTPVPAFFAALRVMITDTEGRPLGLDYTLAEANGSLMGVVRTVEEARSYKDTPTWLVQPGRYTLTLGKSAEAEQDQITISLHPGEVLRYRLVVDGEHIVRAELADREVSWSPSPWRVNWVAGADVSLSRNQYNLSSFNGDFGQLGLFSDANVGLELGNHNIAMTLHAEEAWVAVNSEYGRDLPAQKVTDEVRAELLYACRLGGIVGPYARVSGRTALFDTTLGADQDLTIITRDEAGAQSSGQVAAGDSVKLFDAFAPSFLQEGAGLSLSLLNNDVITFGLRGGAGALQARFNGGRYIQRRTSDTLELLRLDDANLWGAEAQANLGLRLGDVLSIDTTLGGLIPSDQLSDLSNAVPIFRWDNVVTLRLGRYASLVYSASLYRITPAIEELQQRQSLSLRFQYSIF